MCLTGISDTKKQPSYRFVQLRRESHGVTAPTPSGEPSELSFVSSPASPLAGRSRTFLDA